MSRLRTVFISTRTDEAALERRAAYEAAVSQGFVPFTYDASVHRLSSLSVPEPAPPPGGEGRRTKRRATWDHIATLLDQSDYFVGVYDRTLGEPDRPANNMPWLRFELLRFIAHQLSAADQLEAFGVTSANDALRKHELFEQRVHEYLRRPVDDAPGRALHDILTNRMFLFQRLENDERPRCSSELAEFLDPFWQFVRGFNDQVQEELHTVAVPKPSELLPVRAAHALLFRKLSEGLRELRHETPSPGSRGTLQFSLTTGDLGNRPGVLYVFLRTLFQHGLGVQSIWVGTFEDRAPIRGTIVGLHNGSVENYQQVAEQVAASVANALPGSVLQLRSVRPGAPHLTERALQREAGAFRLAQAEAHGTELTYRIQVAWMPGLLWAVVAVATAFDANIVHMSTNPQDDLDNQSPQVGFEVGRTVDVELSVEAMPEVKWWNASEFEYQLKSLHGYVSARVIRGVR